MFPSLHLFKKPPFLIGSGVFFVWTIDFEAGMKGYVIFMKDVHDTEEFERYKSMSPLSIKQYGGEFLV